MMVNPTDPYDNQPLMSTPAVPEPQTKKPWFNVNTPIAIMILGQKRAGKGVLIGQLVRWYLMYGFFVFHLYSGGGFENLYYCVVKNCKARWEKRFEEEPDLRHKVLGCNCHKPVPILVMKPYYVTYSQDQENAFNGITWKNYNEYKTAFDMGFVTDPIPNESYINWNKMKKPNDLIPKVKLFKSMDFVPPTSENQFDTFYTRFLEMIRISRAEDRILVNSPQFYPNTHKGKLEKYTTVACSLRAIPSIAQTELLPYKSDLPRSQWSRKQKSQHKMAVIANEIRAFAPTSQLSGDQESAVSKRATYNFAPELRHYKSWFVFDLQSDSDMFGGIKKQADITIIKRATDLLLGETFGWFSKKIKDERTAFFEKHGKNTATIAFINKTKPEVSRIPDNKGYLVFDNGEHKIIMVRPPTWHLKTEIDNFSEDTGIVFQWNVNTVDDKINKELGTTDASKTSKKSSHQDKDEEYMIIHQKRLGNESFADIITYFKKRDETKGIRDSKWKDMTNKKLSNNYNNWLDKQQNHKK